MTHCVVAVDLTEVKKKARSDAGLFLYLQVMCCQQSPIREQARSHLWNAFPCGASLLAKTPELLTENYLEETR